jgi:pilus assembly protein FimV
VSESAPAADVTDPDDIDALLESMSTNAPVPPQTVKQDLSETVSEPNSDVGSDERSDIDKVAEQGSSLSAEELQIQKERAENEAKIAEFTAEYVTPFLTADFSDIMAKESEAESKAEALESNETNELGDDLDIDALIAETRSKDEVSESIAQDEKDDVGDSLTDLSVDESFTKSELSQLLAEEPLEDTAEQPEDMAPEEIILSPDFNDEDILAELLAETTDSNEEQLENVEELDVIGELNDVDFDELLANIEEESSPTQQDDIEFTLDDIGDNLVDESLDAKVIQNDLKATQTEDYVSVDDLLSGSEEVSSAEPYEKTNIDVGLGQFSQNESGIDVDEDGSMSSQLDLAKMYIEMSDLENAQVILQEVTSKGDVLQKIEAQELLDSL